MSDPDALTDAAEADALEATVARLKERSEALDEKVGQLQVEAGKLAARLRTNEPDDTQESSSR